MMAVVTSPILQIESPPELAAFRMRLQAIPADRLNDIAEFIGADAALIRVVLATENSEIARNTSPWISGFALSEENLVVIFPGRTPAYPDDTLEDVLRHEIAHVLIARESGGGKIPRWF